MSLLVVFDDNRPDQGVAHAGAAAIGALLDGIGVRFERWQAQAALPAEADQDRVLDAYADSIERLRQAHGFQSVDVVGVGPEHPDREALRQKFLAEHTHDDFEVRFFIGGRGLFYLHVAEKVYAVLCGQGDLISVPAHTRHWFDMGARPDFKVIRLFTTADGWQARFTGSDIARSFPDLERFLALYHG